MSRCLTLDANAARADAYREITKLHQRLQTTFIYVTHDQTEAMTMGKPHCGYEGRLHSAGRYAAEPVRLSGQPVCRLLHRQPADELLRREGLSRRRTASGPSLATTPSRVPDSKIRKLVDESYIGKEVIMGIRPENIHDEERFVSVADGQPGRGEGRSRRAHGLRDLPLPQDHRQG